MSQTDSALHSALEGISQPSRQAEMVLPGLPSVAPGRTDGWLFQLRGVASFPVVMAFLLSGVALIGVWFRMADPDTWWHVTIGQQILSTHKWPTTDMFSFTAQGVHWIAYEWLGEVVMAIAAKLGGIYGLAVLQMTLTVAVTCLLFVLTYIRCGNWKAACVATGIFLPIAGPSFSMRPQFFGYVFLLVTLVCLERFRQGHAKWLLALPPLFLVWVNTHGTFAIGLAMVGLYYVSGLFKFQLGGLTGEQWTAQQRVQLSLTFFLCLVALTITPYGRELAAYPIQMATMQPLNIANIQEWQPLTLTMGLGKYFLGLMLAFFAANILFPRKYRLEEIIMLLFGIYAVCVHLRFLVIFVMLVTPVVARYIAEWMPPYQPSKERYAFNLAFIVLLAISFSKFLPSKQQLSDKVAKDYPVAAVNYLREHPQPTGMFNDYGYGGYLIWQLGPQQKVFIDGRADFYEYSGVFQDYLKIITMDREALPLLRRYNIQSCVIHRESALATLLAATPGWKQTYVDEYSVIFVATHAQNPAGD